MWQNAYLVKKSKTKRIAYDSVMFFANIKSERISETAKSTTRTSATETTSKTSYRDWETDRKSTRLNSSHRSLSRMPSSA